MRTACAAAVAACLALATAVPAAAQTPAAQTPAAGSGAGIRIGYLTCQVARGVGFVFGMTRNLACTFAPSSGTPERYVGEIQQYGVNVGFVDRGVIIWGVVAPSTSIEPGSLAGNYGGVAAGVALGYGLGANALFGGSNSQFGLQPISFEGMQGLNVAAGIAGLSLRPARARPAGGRRQRQQQQAPAATPAPQQ